MSPQWNVISAIIILVGLGVMTFGVLGWFISGHPTYLWVGGIGVADLIVVTVISRLRQR